MAGVADGSPQERRDAAIAQVVAAGGTVVGVQALADPADPGVVVAFRLDVGVPRLSARAGVDAVRAATESGLEGLVAWVDPAGVES